VVEKHRAIVKQYNDKELKNMAEKNCPRHDEET
jgi:hypothetical protein